MPSTDGLLIDDTDIGDGRAPLQSTDGLNLSPGVLVQNRNNFAQNPRVSIRGFGARAPFGIRGVRVRLDGFPLTTVDGQAQIDAIDPSSIQTIEVLRGANAVLHGNGSGGLLGPDKHLSNRVESPVMAWPEGDFSGAYLSFDAFIHEDLSMDSPYIFGRWQVRSTSSSDPDDILTAHRPKARALRVHSSDYLWV